MRKLNITKLQSYYLHLFNVFIFMLLFSSSTFYGQNIDTNKMYSIHIKSASGKALDLKNNSKNDGTKIIPVRIGNSKTQKFYLKSAGNNYYYIYNALSKKVIDANKKTSSVSQWAFHGGDNQKWKFVAKPNGYYCIQNKKTKKFFDISASKNVLIQYGLTGNANQQFKLMETSTSSAPALGKLYKINIKSQPGKVLDIKGVSTSDGAKIHPYKSKTKNAENQKFYLKSAGGDYYYIYSALSNKVIDASKKTSSVSQWAFHGGDNQKWKFVTKPNGYYCIQNKKTKKYLDISGSKNILIQYGLTGNANQQYKFTQVKGTPKDYISESGFRVKINGLYCLQTNDDVNGADEPYFEIWADGKKVKTTKSRKMNESDRSWWEKINDDIDALTQIAQQEFWLMPGSVYAEREVIIKLYEEDDGRGDDLFINNDDFIGEVKITKSTANSNYIKKEFRSKEEGDWDLVYSKSTRSKIDFTVEGTSRKVKVRVPILDQGNEGACVAFSVVGALTTTYLNKITPGTSKKELFDPLKLYDRRDQVYKDLEGGGWYISEALNEILKNGIPFKNNGKTLFLKSFYEYKKDGTVTKYSMQGNRRIATKIERADNNGYNKMRKVIKGGKPLLANYIVHPDFMAYAGVQGIYGGQIAENQNKGSHAVFVVGYKNPKLKSNSYPTWILQNSWAPSWGKNGLCEFAEGACDFDDIMYEIGEFEVR